MNIFTKTKRFVALFAVMIIGLVVPSFGQAAVPFSDVSSNHWAYGSIEWSYNKKLLTGYSNGTFGPKRTLTEAEFIVMLTRYDCSGASRPKSKSGDRHWAAPAYAYAKSKNIPLNGYDNATFRDQPVSRGQVARIVAAFHGLDLSQEHAVQYMYVKQLSSGKTGVKNYTDYGAEQSLNRAEAAVFLHRLAGQGSCNMKGLTQNAASKDNKLYPLPAHFLAEGTVTFPLPDDETVPTDEQPAADPRIQSADIEKKTLIANGRDSTFITLTLKDCFGNPISYEESLYFQAFSKGGASVSEGVPFKEEDETEVIGSLNELQNRVQTDGPDLTVNVTAPASTNVEHDTISFQLLEEKDKTDKMACYRTPVFVDLNYIAKAELQVQAEQSILTANGETKTHVTAKIVQPGGQVIRDYTGHVRFYSAQGAFLSSTNVSFSNGTASIEVTALSSSSPVKDTIYVELIGVDSRHAAISKALQAESHSTPILYDPGFSTVEGCKREDLEVAFIVDSSGSMKRSDPEKLRVSKSKELLSALQAPLNITTRFNHQGEHLYGSDPLSQQTYDSLERVDQSGGTNIADGMGEAFGKFESGPNSRKIAILVTDGKSNEQQILSQIKYAQNNQITIYTVGLGSKTQLNETLLQRVAAETGGQYFHVEKSSSLTVAYQAILFELSCGELFLGCAPSGAVFSSPSLRMTKDTFYMDTFVDEACSEVARVVLRLHSADGTVDYDLIYRGQQYFALKKDQTEIQNLLLSNEGTFLAYDKDGTLIGKQTVPF